MFSLGNLFVIGFPFLFMGISAFLFLYAAITFFRAQGARNWPRTPGTVILTQIEHDHDDNGWHHRSIITYKYEVNGNSFQNNILAFGAKNEWFDDEKGRVKAEKMANQYPIGGSVVVHYNPSNPADAVLEVRAAQAGPMLIIAIIMALLGICLGSVFNLLS
jgi:hypothetical protein